MINNIAPIKSGESTVRLATLAECFEIGGWQAMLGFDDICYSRTDAEDAPDYYYHAILERDRAICGYIIGYAYNDINECSGCITRHFEITDLAISVFDNKKEAFSSLLDFAKRIAEEEGASDILVRSKSSKYPVFFMELKEYGAVCQEDYYSLKVDRKDNDPRKHLCSYPNDGLDLKLIHLLFALGFKIKERSCSFTLRSGAEILVDRRDGEIFYPHSLLYSTQPRFCGKQNTISELLYAIREERDGRLNCALNIKVCTFQGAEYSYTIQNKKLVIFKSKQECEALTKDLSALINAEEIQKICFFDLAFDQVEEKITASNLELTKDKFQ